MSTTTAATLAYYGVFPSVVAFVCYNRGVSSVGPTRAGIFVHLVPVFGIILSTLVLTNLHEPSTLPGWRSSLRRHLSDDARARRKAG
ncbi:MAG: DMT family transporter [Betaproteobacteria bacterium]|nr:DMT family transporter [Betaproteobacteria bacterium]